MVDKLDGKLIATLISHLLFQFLRSPSPWLLIMRVSAYERVEFDEGVLELSAYFPHLFSLFVCHWKIKVLVSCHKAAVKVDLTVTGRIALVHLFQGRYLSTFGWHCHAGFISNPFDKR